MFSTRLGAVIEYAGLLVTVGVERGLLGPREAPGVWERHLLNCAVAVADVPAGADVADVGSGAGLPGLVWAMARPDLSVTLIEPLLRRFTFLAEAVAALHLERVEVLRARAEDLAGHRSFDVVTARAVAPLDRLAGWCLPLVRPGGWLLAMKGESAAQELSDAQATLRRAGATHAEVRTYGEGRLATPVRVVSLQRRSESPRPTTPAADGEGTT
ncbi:MAG: 16S rRNA (guanine(527)-N(7))-methyltransferase RsmG [Nocardioidaceae bacterium]